AARDRAIAVLDDRGPARGREQRRAGRQVQAAGTVAPGADDVDVLPRRDLGSPRELAHREREAADLARRLALLPERDQEGAGDGRLDLAGRERAQQSRRAVLVEIVAGEHALEELRRTDAAHRRRSG